MEHPVDRHPPALPLAPRRPSRAVTRACATLSLVALLVLPAVAAADLGVSFQSPGKGVTVVHGVAVQFESYQGADPDGNGIVQRRYVLKIDGTTVADFTATFPISFQESGYAWDTTAYADGPHLFELTVFDEVGHSASAPPVAWGVQNHPSGAGAPDGSALTASVLLSPAPDPLSGHVGVAVRADHAPAGASALLTLSVDGVDLATETQPCMEGSCMRSWVLDTRTLDDGVHAITGSVTLSGGGSATETTTVRVTNVAIAGPQPVVWVSPVKVAVQGDRIWKNAGCDGCGDSGAVSKQTITSGDGAVEFTTSGSSYLTVGLSTGNAGTSANEIAFGLRFYPGNIVEVRERGAYKADWLAAPSATHRIAVEGGIVKYYLDGALKYTSTQAPTYPLLVDTAIWTIGAGLSSAVITTGGGGGTPPPGPQPVVWTSAVKATVNGNAVTKAEGCDGCFDAGAVSQQLIDTGGGSVTFTTSPGAFLMIGLSNGNPGTSGNEIDFALRFYPGSPAIVEVRESGVYKWDWLTTAGAAHRIALDTGVVKYYENGVLKYTSTIAPSLPLLVDTALGTVGAGVQNAVIGP